MEDPSHSRMSGMTLFTNKTFIDGKIAADDADALKKARVQGAKVIFYTCLRTSHVV